MPNRLATTAAPFVSLVALVALVTLVVAAAPPAWADGEKIVEIEIVDNTKTNDETVRVIADVDVGDTFTFQLADRIKVDLVNSGLFKDVNVLSGPSMKGPGVKLTISAKDKFSWIIAPTFYNQPGNVGGGVGYGENNLFGENKKLLLYGQIATADSLFFAVYLDPSLGGSKHFYWRIDTFARHEKVTEFDNTSGPFEKPKPFRISTENYFNAGLLLGVNLWKGMSLDGRLRGAKVYFTDAHCDEAIVPVVPECNEDPEEEGYDVSTEWKLTYDKRANWYGVVTGNMLQASFEPSLPALGSTYDYWVAYGKVIHARKYWSRHNLVLKGSGGYGNNVPFQQEFTSGGVGLRGYENRQFRGNFKLAGTVEYSVPVLTIGPLAFRGLTFSDVAYTTFLEEEADNPQRRFIPNQTDTTEAQLRFGVGAGFRIYVRSIVLPLLGIDWGYAPQTNEWNIYFAVGLTEL